MSNRHFIPSDVKDKPKDRRNLVWDYHTRTQEQPPTPAPPITPPSPPTPLPAPVPSQVQFGPAQFKAAREPQVTPPLSALRPAQRFGEAFRPSRRLQTDDPDQQREYYEFLETLPPKKREQAYLEYTRGALRAASPKLGAFGALGLVAESWQKGVMEPAAALSTVAVQKVLLANKQEIEGKFEEYRRQGMGITEASTRAYNESDLPKFVKGLIELGADPLNLLPGVGFGGGIARVTGAVGRATARGVRAAPSAVASATERVALGGARPAYAAWEGVEGAIPKVGDVLDHPQLGKVTVTDISDPNLLGVRTEADKTTRMVDRDIFGTPADPVSSDVHVAAVNKLELLVKPGGAPQKVYKEALEVAPRLSDEQLDNQISVGSAYLKKYKATKFEKSRNVHAMKIRVANAEKSRRAAFVVDRVGGKAAPIDVTPGEKAVAEGAMPSKYPTADNPNIPRLVQPTKQQENILGLMPIKVGLTKEQEFLNIFRRIFDKAKVDDPRATPAFDERSRVRPIIESQANIMAAQLDNAVRRVFTFDETGMGIPGLRGIDASVPGAPTLVDVAARLPRYWDNLKPDQKQVMDRLRNEVGEYEKLLREVADDVSPRVAALPPRHRADIIEGGFYLPRGRAAQEGVDEPIKFRGQTGFRAGKKGFEKPAFFTSQAEGINQKWEYSSLHDSIQSYAVDAGTKATDMHVGKFLKGLTDETGRPLGQTPKMRMLSQNPDIAIGMQGLRLNLARLRGLTQRLSEKTHRAIDNFMDNPDVADIDAFKASIGGIRITKGKSVGADLREVRAALKAVKDDIKALRKPYNDALERAMGTSRERNLISLPSVQNRTFPDEVANAANKILAAERPETGWAGRVQAFNNLYRGLRATADNSAPGIQGLLGWYSAPRSTSEALKLNLRAWDPGGDKLLGQYLNDFNAKATSKGRRLALEWGRDGLHIGGVQTEMMLGKGLPSRIGKLPLVRQANRAFGIFGDTLRLEWADDMLRNELATRTLNEVIASGDLKRIAKIANNMTGWSGKRFGSAVGDLLIFAPRFLQSRLTTVTKAALGLRPGAALDQRIARSSILKMVGFGTMLTFSLNWMQGRETDVRPMVKGRYNPNFMRVRFAGRDWSLFGTWDSLARLFVTIGTGHPEQAIRGMASGIVSLSADFVTGENFVGKDVPNLLSEPIEAGAYLGRQMAPFAAEEIPQAIGQIATGEIVPGAVTIVGEMVGAKSYPLSFTDMKDIVSGELFGMRYDDPKMGRGDRRQVSEDERVKEFVAAFPEQQIDIKDRSTVKYQDYERTVNTLETELKNRIDAGLTGDSLADAIRTFKRDRYMAGQTVFDDPIIAGELAKREKPIKDVLAEAYWSAPVPVNPQTGELDFRARDSLREGILRDAKEKGVSVKYITGDGEGSYKSVQYSEPVVGKVIEDYEQDMDYLKEKYWVIGPNFKPSNPGVSKAWQKYLMANDRLQLQMREQMPQIKHLVDEMNRLRGERRQWPRIAWIRFKWGYTATIPTMVPPPSFNVRAGRQSIGAAPAASGAPTSEVIEAPSAVEPPVTPVGPTPAPTPSTGLGVDSLKSLIWEVHTR